MLEVGLVNQSDIHALWPDVKKFVDWSCAESFGDITSTEVKLKILSGEWVLIVAFDGKTKRIEGVVIAHVFNRINDRVAFVTVISGKFMTNEYSFGRLKELLIALGATCIEGNVRDSVLKLLGRLGFVKKTTTISYPL